MSHNQSEDSPSGKKRDRSNVDENGRNKDKRYRENKKLRLLALEEAEETTEIGPSLGSSEQDSPSRNLMVPTETQRVGAQILKALKEGKHPFAICEELDSEDFEELRRFRAIEVQVVEWLSKWGGIAHWPEWLEMSYNEAVKYYGVEDWFEQVWDQADKGRRLETRLFEMYGSLPKEHYKVKELYRRSTELLHLLAKATALIEIRVPLIPDKYAIQKIKASQAANSHDSDDNNGLDEY
ncbi:hypothetical protein NP233_g11863 [Leucocoprinus birnbaumii]|uniref:Uncharacterized protein n=1 Tax=Leucocoprinus birnbaumii TaxID=56174 RepID=A0AAD5YJZ3_9AGAR|nr:hypothetical protein NP233_g11863 [Leucocoprinus birnbaumii]